MEISVDDFGSVTLRVPKSASDAAVRAFFESKREWAERHADRLKSAPAVVAFTDAEIAAMTAKARAVIPGRVAHFARLMGVSFGRITVRRQVTKWGSCTAKGDLSFNCMLALMPGEVLDGVVAHELCHVKHMDHSPEFYREIYAIMPDYDSRRRWLRENGNVYMRRMRLYREGEKR